MDKLFWQDLSAALMLSFGHFLWIGALIAMATALVVRQQRTSARRYQSWLAGFAVMALSPVITLLVLQGIDPASLDIVTQPTPAPSNSPPIAVAKPDPPGEVGSLPPRTDLTTLTVPLDLPPAATPTALDARPRLATERRESPWWRAYAPLVTNLYLMGVALLGLRLLVGLWGGRRLQRRAIPITESSLLFALHRQAVAMGMKCKPVLAYCERVTVPTVLGILTPTILLPISVMSGLTPEQIESVLAHELAHLRRCDHIVNLLQRVVESLLFFHPAVWWVSRCIRDEREHCCDDLVIACGAVPLEYAQSLLRVAELSREAELHKSNQRRSFTAVSLLATGDRPSTLRQRVGRLLGYQTDLNVRVVRPWSLVGLAIGCLCIVGMLTSMTWIAVAEINHVDPEPVVEHAPTIAIADLPQGVKVEFVGLTRMNEEDRTWWTPDGVDLSPIPKLPIGHGKFSISQNGKAVDVRRFLIHVHGVDDFKSIAVSASGTNIVEQDSAGRQFVSFSGVLGPADSTLRVGVATEPISPKRILDAKGIQQPLASDAPQDSVAEDIVVTSVEPFSPIKAESIVHTTLHYEMPVAWKQVDLRIVAVDKSGTEHHSATIGSKQPEPNASIWKHSVTFPLPPDQVDRFEYQFRLYRHCAIFKNIAQNAGDRTQLAISTELIPETTPPSAPPPAVDPRAKQPFAAELPNGIRLELSGVLNGTDKGPAAWSPDGSPMVVPKEWPRLLRAKDQNPTRGFVFRSQGLVKGQGIVWRLTGRWVTPILSETIPEYVGISSNLEDRTVKLRVGITDTWGPWQRVEPDGSIKARVEVTSQFRDVYSRVKSALIIGGQEGGTSELRTGFVLGIDETDDQAEYESVAVDREGKRHDRRGVDSWKKKTIPFYSLPLSQIDHFEFRLQPHLHWVTFDNVSLIPGEQTDVKVTAEVKQAQPIELVGMVRLVDSTKQLVEITLGLADGVKVGDRFDVHDWKRVNDSWKSQIEVIQVAQDSAVARILKIRANQRVTRSDRVKFAEPAPVTRLNDNDAAANVDTAKMSTVELAQRAILQMERRRLMVGRHSASQVMQGLKAFGRNYHVRSEEDPNELSPAWDWIAKGRMPPNPTPLWVIRDGIAQGMPFTRPFESEGVPGQFVAWLGAAGVSLEAQVTAINENGIQERITVQRLVDELQKLRQIKTIGGDRVQFQPDWQLWALAHYSTPSTIWDMTRPKGQGIVELIERQLDEPDLAHPYDGAVGLLGLAIARTKYMQLDAKSKKDASAILARIENRLDQALTSVRSHQSTDGWLYRSDLPREHRELVHLQFTGLELAWLSQALSSDELHREIWISNAARRVALELLGSKHLTVPEMTDAILGLRMYLAKVAPGSVPLDGGQGHNDSSPSSKGGPDPRVPSKVDTETVVGTVVSPDGQVVPGIEVLAFQGAIQLDHKFVTDARGEFRVPKAWRDVDHWLTVVARDGRDRLGWFDFMIHGHSDKGQKAEDGSFRLVLLPMSRTVHGRVVDESGMPLAQIPIQINQLDHDVNSTAVHWKYQKLGDAPLVAGAITDNDGRYELKLPSDTTAWLSTNHPDWADERIRSSSENDLGQTKLLRAARISGRIIDSRTGTPLPAVGVTAIATRTDFLQSSGGDAMTDAQGNYVISGLRHGEYTIQVLPGHESILTAPAYEKVTLKSGETFVADFPLTVGKRLAGRVLDSTTGEPIPNCKVTCTGPSAPASALSTETNERGEFEFRVSPGINAVDAREGRIFGADSERKINVAVNGDPEPVVLKVGPMTPAVPGQKIKIFMGRPLDRKVTVDFQKKPLAEVLAAICTEAGMTLELDEDGLSAAGTSKETPVTLVEPKPVTLQRALTLIFASHAKLAYLVGKHRVYVSSRELVDARKRLLESGDFPENDRF